MKKNNFKILAFILASNLGGSIHHAMAQTNTSLADNANIIPGNYNIGIGINSLTKSYNGYYNTSVGYFALNLNSYGNYNVANGFFALTNNSRGSYNTALGMNSLRSNSTASYNTAIGTNSLFTNTTGERNTANGYQSLYNNITGWYNSAFGVSSLFSNTTGFYNIAIGAEALYSNTSGGDNIATGYQSLYNNQGGYTNVASGRAALYYNTAGSNNVAIGGYALSSLSSGSSNTALGYRTNVPYGTDLNNVTVIGANASATCSNSVVIGDGLVTSIGGYSNWCNLSDARFKKNIKEDVHGLDFILKLKTVTYNMDVKRLNNFLGVNENKASLNNESKINKSEDANVNKAIAEKEAIRYSGFLAQDVEKVAKSVGYDFSGVIKPANEKDHYKMSYSDFVVPLVKAIQEQQQQIEELKKMIASKDEVKVSAIELSDKNSVVLNQNVPNPFASQTSISYSTPLNANNAQILFYDATGRLIKAANINKGKGQLNVFANDLTTGTYNYSLVVDGKVIDTKKLSKQ